MGDIVYLPGKLLQEAIYPFNWAILCFFVSAYLVRRNRNRIAFRIQMIGLFMLIVPATGYFSRALIAPLESLFPAIKSEDAPNVDAIVVLGGTTAKMLPPRLEAEELYGARLQAAIRLFRAGKAKTIIVTGGPYRVATDTYRSEAQDMCEVLVGLGVPRDSIVMEPNSRNTYENAVFTADLLRERSAKRVLLVTSALHLPRATALFQKQGVDVIPIPSSFLRGPGAGPIFDLKPDVGNLHDSESAIKEYVGRIVYWLLGRA